MTTASFPPVDDLIDTLSKIEYKKHLNTFMDTIETIVLYVLAISYVIYQKVSQWYQNGGKNLIQEKYRKVKDFFVISYLWMLCEGCPRMIRFFQEVQKTYHSWQDLVTV